MIDPNQLRQWMEFYRTNMPQTSDSLGGIWGGMGAMDQANQAGNRLNFALRMMGDQGMGGNPRAQMPDFFGGAQGSGYSPAEYVQPQRFMGPQVQPNFAAPQAPLGQQTNNYLAHILGRR